MIRILAAGISSTTSQPSPGFASAHAAAKVARLIADRLRMGSRGYLTWLLQRHDAPPRDDMLYDNTMNWGIDAFTVRLIGN
jgi:hypothetical protein